MEALKHFFDEKYNKHHFEMFGQQHMLVLYTIATFLLLIVIFRNKIKTKTSRIIKITASIVAITFEIFFHVWNYVNRNNFISSLFYFDLCSITFILSCILNLAINLSSNKRYAIFELIYFWNIGAIGAIIFPNIVCSANKFRFYHFFITHAYILLTTFYGVVIEKYKITLKSYFRSLKVLYICALFVFFVDHIFKQNYMFLLHAPESVSPLRYLGGGIKYYLNFMLLGATVLFIFYLPFGITNSIVKAKKINMITGNNQ